MEGNCFRRKMFIIVFYSLNVKGNWAHLAEQNSQQGAKMTTMFTLS